MAKVSKREPLISIIVPIYNVELYLDECIESIINQTYSNLEIILIDDGSVDNSGKICDKYAKKDKRIRVIHKKNSGVSDSRNYGIKISNGQYIAFIDSDDYVENNYIEVLYTSILDYNADISIVGYNKVYNSKFEKIELSDKKTLLSSEEFLIKLLNVQTSYGFCHMKLYKKSILSNVLFLTNLKVGEDALFNMEICKNIKSVVINEDVLYNYRFHSNSVVRKYDPQYVDKYQTAMEKTSEYINKNYKNNAEIKKNLSNYIAYHLLLICVNYCFNPNNTNKYKSLKSVCKINLFKEAIKNSNYDDLSLSRKISLFTLKYKLYFFMAIICIIRQYQFKK